MKKVLFLVISLFVSSNAVAYFDGGASATTGEDGYSGGKVFLIVGSDNMWLKPALDYYKSDNSTGTYKTYSLRAGYDKNLYSVAGGFGKTPEVGGYENTYVEGDITFTLTSNGSRKGRLAGPQSSHGASGGKGLTRIDIGGAAKHIMHKYCASGSSLDSRDINQTDLSAFAGLKFLKTRLSINYTASSYDKTLSATDRQPQAVNITGLTFIGQGLPKSSVNMKLAWSNMPFVAPYVSYTKTKFELSQKDSKSYVLGANIDLTMLDLNASYEIYDDGIDKDNFVSLTAGLQF
ncbi:MAG: hypothetical protein U9Q34_06030 [Elusimicrobiota bacterium]|nr:hypothetical protein [Elusimicrobiota bacterium]